MKRKTLKKRYRLHIIIITVLIVSCILFMSVFTIFTFNSTKERLKLNAIVEFKEIYSSVIQDFAGTASLSFITYHLNYWGCNNMQSYDKNLYVAVKNQDGFYFETGNKINVSYGANTENSVYYENPVLCDFSHIDFEKFRKSMTDEQYNKISDYLNKPVDKDGYYYALRCTKYYFNEHMDVGIFPAEITVVKTCDDYTWFCEEDVVEKFKLSPDMTEEEKKDTKLRIIGKTYQNAIDTDFFLGKYEKEMNMEYIKSLDLYGERGIKEADIDLFNFVLVSDVYFSRVNLIDTVDENDNSHKVYAVIDGNVNADENEENYTVTMARKINVADACLGTILTGSIIILFFFTILFLLETAAWKTSKTRAIQEQNRIEMVNAVAHNLKTPLFVIGGFSENLKNESDKNKRQHFIDVIQQQTEQMNTLVYRMLDMSRLSSPQINMNKEKFSLNTMVSDLTADYSQCTDKEFIFDFNSEEEITADKDIMKTALENLIDNAVKHSVFDSEIRLRVEKGYFGISNKCKELSKDEIKNLWQPYYRKNDGDNTSGNGIGLSTVKTAMELHRFKYGADYSDCRITFWFRF